MKKLVSLFVLFCLLFCFMPLYANARLYNDVSPYDWFAPAVEEVTRLGIMTGVGNGNFAPREGVNRAMTVQLLYNIFGKTTAYSPYFTDVKANAWYAAAVTWAKENKIVSGTSADRFSPNKLITRQELACILADIARSGDKSYGRCPSDIDKADSWAVSDIEFCCEYGFFSLRDSDAFAPKATVSRAELAATLLRVLGDYENGVYDPTLHVECVMLSVQSATLIKGQKITLSAQVYPYNSNDKKIGFTSSAPDVAIVDNKGNVTALAPGKAVISTLSRDGGISARCGITVKAAGAVLPTMQSVKGIIDICSSYDAGAMYGIGNKRRIDPNKPMVALTYDDGPQPKSSNRILDCLEKYSSVATFFELGICVEQYPEIVARKAALGCELGNHSYDHPDLTTVSAAEVKYQIEHTNELIFKASGINATLLRPPNSKRNDTVRAYAGVPIILYSVDTNDWRYKDADYIFEQVKKNVKDGSVVLMHSIHLTTAQATEKIVPWLISQGYQLVTVSEMAQLKGYKLKNGTTYFAFYNF